jgi:hypothetical protein
MNINKKNEPVMQKNKTLSLLLVLAIVAAMPAYLLSQSIGRVGTTAAPFLKIGIGARALAMGEAYTSRVEDVTGVFWNPAGIAGADRMELLFNHYSYVADMNYEFGAAAIPVAGFGTIGAFIGSFGYGEIERTTVTSPEGTGEKVSASSMVVGLSYARALTDRFAIGANVKYVREQIWHSYATGIAFDVGVLYKAFFKNIKLGMSISNFGTEMQLEGRDMLVQHDINPSFAGNNENINANLETEKFPMPILFRMGLSADILKDFLNMSDYGWVVAVDAIHPNDNKEYINIGTELNLYNVLSLRGGYRELMLEDREGGLTFGVGLKLDVLGGSMNLDYANVDLGRLDHQNKFTLILSF